MIPGRAALVAAVCLLGASGPAHAYMKNRGPVPALGASDAKGPVTQDDINIVENLGERVPKELAFTDGHGRRLELRTLLDRGKPVLVTMGYFHCPQLCDLVHEGLAKVINGSGLKVGKDFLGLAVSFDPNEDAKSANTKQARLLRALGHGGREDWPFVYAPGGDAAASTLAERLGVRYKYDGQSKQFAHAPVVVLLAPDGKISRYVYGVDYPSRDFRMAVVEASGGKVGTSIDRVILSCFRYDPMAQRYTPYLFGFVRIGAFASFLALVILLAILWRRELVMRRRRPA